MLVDKIQANSTQSVRTTPYCTRTCRSPPGGGASAGRAVHAGLGAASPGAGLGSGLCSGSGWGLAAVSGEGLGGGLVEGLSAGLGEGLDFGLLRASHQRVTTKLTNKPRTKVIIMHSTMIAPWR